MTIFEFTSKIENILETEVKKLLPGYWNEDQLTINFLLSLRSELSNTIIENQRGPLKVLINAFKQSGRILETNYGDIAVIVKITYPDGETLEGVGFLEAKKRAIGSVRFDTVKLRQLKTIISHAPRARLLLYDYEPITVLMISYPEFNFYYSRSETILRFMPTTYSVAIPLNLALTANHFDTALYKFGLPFSHQITFRYMFGHDLEFDKKTLEACKGFSDKNRLSDYILTITIGPEDKVYEPDNYINSEYFDILK